MKLRKILLTVITCLFLFTVVSCDNNKKDDVKFTATPISTVLSTYTNNQDTKIEGIVYGVIKNGFYISDSNESGIFVVMGDSWKSDVKIGDKVQVTGQFSISNNFTQVKNVTNTKIVSSNNQITLTSSELTISQVNALNYTSKTGSYGKLITVTANVEKNSAGTIVLKDDEGKSVILNNQSNELINDYLSKRIKLSVIAHRYDSTSNCWIVSFGGTSTDITNAELTFATIVEMAKEHIDSVVPTEFFGNLVLPTEHPTFSNITYTWKVEENEYVSVEGTTVTIKIDEIDHAIKFYVTINYQTNSEKVTYELTSKAIVPQTISNLLANKPLVNMSTITTSGIVVAITRNQSTSLRSFVLQDKTTLETIVVDFSNKNAVISNTSDEFKAVKIGDEIKITGLFDNGERCSIESVSSLEIISSNNEVKHDKENALELSDEESYNNLGKEYKNYVGKLVKITNPYLNYSTSSTPADTNWVRFGWNNKSGNSGFGISGDTHVFAFLIAAQNESLGSDSWHTNYDIPFINNKNGAKQFNVTYYVYPVYYEDSTYLQFIIPSAECIEVGASEKINLDLASQIPSFVDKSVTSSIELPTTHELAGTISWRSSNEDVLSGKGVIGNVTKSTNVTLTAEYVYEGIEIKTEFVVCVLPEEAETITSVLENTDDTYVKFNGIVISYISDGNAVESRNGILVLDPENGKTLLVTNLTAIGGTIGNYVDSNGTTIEIGDEITAIGKYSLSSGAIGTGPVQTGRNSVELSSKSSLTVDVKDVNFNYHLENAIEITNQSELEAFTENVQYGTVIKLVGTKDNPIYIGGSSSDATKVNFKVFYTETGAPADDASAAKYDGTIYSLKGNVVGYTWGETWYNELFGITKAFVGPNKSNSGVAITGEIYVAIAYRTSTYFQMCAIAVDQWDVSREGTVDDVKSLLTASIPSSLENGVQNFTLPTKTIYTTGEITWVSLDSTLFDIETMTVYAANEDKEVSLNATFTLNDEEQTITVKVVVSGLLNKIEKTEISSLLKNGTNNTLQIVEGIVVSYHSDGNSSGDLRGVILMDSTTNELLLIDGAQKLTPTDKKFSHGTYYATNGIVLQIGDKVEILGKYVINGTRKSLLIVDNSYINVVSNNNQITWGNPTVTITNNDEMTAFAANLQVGVLVKFVGTEENPFCFGGSTNDSTKTNYKFFYNADAIEKEDVEYKVTHGSVDKKSLIFSFKAQVNVCTLGDNWWDTYFGLPAAFVGPTLKPSSGYNSYKPYTYSGTIYAVVSAVTSTYVQMSFVNVSEISATMIQNGTITTEA